MHTVAIAHAIEKVTPDLKSASSILYASEKFFVEKKCKIPKVRRASVVPLCLYIPMHLKCYLTAVINHFNDIFQDFQIFCLSQFHDPIFDMTSVTIFDLHQVSTMVF